MSVTSYAIKQFSKVRILVCLAVLFWGCERENFSDNPIPSIEIIEAASLPHPKIMDKDSIINLRFSFKDGDGDIGIPEDDTLSFSDFLVDFREIVDGEEKPYIIPISNDTLNFNQRLPYLTPSGKDKSIKGEILIEIPISPFPGFSPDSVVFTAVLFDRAGNQSNSVRTSVIKIRH